MQSKEVVLGVGQTLRLSLGFTALAVRINNPSTGWIKLNGNFVIPAMAFGGVISLIPGNPNPTIENSATDPAGVAVLDNGQVAEVTFYDTALPGQAPTVQTIALGVVPGVVIGNQGLPNAGGADAWPVTGTITSNQGAAGAAPWLAKLSPAATHGKLRNLAAAVQAIKAGPGTVFGVQVMNTSGATAYVKIFDKAAGDVALAADTADLELQVAAGATASLILPAEGVAFGVAISAASTTTEAGAVGSAAGVMVFLQYE